MSVSKRDAGSFSIATLGCKLNQYESECIRQYLVRRRWEYRPFGAEADFYIINTCTVTGKSDARCRNLVRRARRAAPGARIIVTGCYAETQPDALAAMSEPDLVIGNAGKWSIARIMEELRGEINGCDNASTGNEGMYIREFLDHARAFIKIQDGCDAACAYCIIPRARGGSRSVPAREVLAQVHCLEENGMEEIVLTGVHIGRYGRDIPGNPGLDGLLELLSERTTRPRFRLGSVEVNEITDRLIRLAATSPRIAAHLHVPLQSGDDGILRAMNRPYDTGVFRARIEKVREASETVAIGTDIIVGFPGETEEQFKNTRVFLTKLPLTYFHVFSFSPRPGTAAAEMTDRIDPGTKKRRSRELIWLGQEKRAAFMRERAGTRELALIQGHAGGREGFSTALTGSYCEVLVRNAVRPVGTLASVAVTHYRRGKLYGRIDGDVG